MGFIEGTVLGNVSGEACVISAGKLAQKRDKDKKSDGGIDLARLASSFEMSYVSDVAAVIGLKSVRYTWKVVLF